MNKEEAYSGEWPVKPYYKRDLAIGVRPRYYSRGGVEPSFRLDTPSQVALSGSARFGLCGQTTHFQFSASGIDFPLSGKTVISG